jgi:deoxyadenosine/deoxycytidine kinase
MQNTRSSRSKNNLLCANEPSRWCEPRLGKCCSLFLLNCFVVSVGLRSITSVNYLVLAKQQIVFLLTMSSVSAFFFRHRGLTSLALHLRSGLCTSASSSTSSSSVHNTSTGPSSSSFHPVLVSIEGNIGAGKTTLLNELRARHPEWISIDEPVETWSSIQNEQGESILEIFYKDRRRWSYTFQNCALLTRFQNIERAVSMQQQLRRHQELQPPPHGTDRVIFLTERCLDTDYHVFTKMLLEEGSIDPLEISLYERLLNQLKKTATPLSAIVHVNTAPTLCATRIQSRGRHGEEAISMNYLDRLHHYQVNWINSTEIPKLVTHSQDVAGVETFIRSLTKPVSEVAKH